MYYANSSRSGLDIIVHISSLKTLGLENVPVSDESELMDAVAVAGATRIMFEGMWMPQRSMSVDHPKIAYYIRRQFAGPGKQRCDERGCRKAAQDGDIFCAEHRRLENERTAAWRADPDNQAWIDSIIDR